MSLGMSALAQKGAGMIHSSQLENHLPPQALVPGNMRSNTSTENNGIADTNGGIRKPFGSVQLKQNAL